MSSRLAVLGLVALFAVGASGQNSASVTRSASDFMGSAHFGPPSPFGVTPITGAPYSGEEVTEMVQTLADGTHITRTMPSTKLCRDSLGRTRTERPMFRGPTDSGPNAPEAPVIVEINDPVAQAKYILDTQNKIAHRQELPAPGARPAIAGAANNGAGALVGTVLTGRGGGSATAPAGQIAMAPPPNVAGQAADVARPQMLTEKVGTQTIEGVLVEGTRHTTTWPVGSQGNDRPITSATETWMSPELRVAILTKMNDPRSGEHTQKLINISRSEPSPSLFQPPPDYTVVDEKADFTIKWGPRQQ